MAIFKIKPIDSIISTTIVPFSSDNVGPDTLIVDPSAFLFANSPTNAGAVLGNLGAWTVTINGSVTGATGIDLASGNAATSTITVGLDGSVLGTNGNGIAAHSAVKIINNGEIFGSSQAILLDDGIVANTITNTATGVLSGQGSTAILDFGGTSNDTVTNSGIIVGNVDVAGGNNSVTNSSSIFGNLLGGARNDTFINSGQVSSAVDLGDRHEFIQQFRHGR